MEGKANGSRTGLEPIAKRVSIERKIDLRFPNFEGLITRMSANLSTSGMFVQTDTPKAPGSEFDFSIRIEEWSPIQGTARVVWTRAVTESPERPAGMGVQFLELDPQSRRMIRWLVDKHREEGGQPFDVGRVPAGASSRHPEVSGTHAVSTHQSRLPIRLWGALALVALALAGYGAYRLWPNNQPSRSQHQTPPVPMDRAFRAQAGETEIGAEDRAVRAETSAMTRASAESVAAFVRVWSTAWETRDAQALKALYATEFEGSAYGGRRSWESEIDQRMSDSDYIRIAVSALEIDFPTADSASATFYRSIRSNLGDETQRMTLKLEPYGESWKILGQRLLD